MTTDKNAEKFKYVIIIGDKDDYKYNRFCMFLNNLKFKFFVN